jgi:histidinol dehydrogenase
MRTLHHASKTFADDLAAFCRGSVVPKEITDSVAAILADVRVRGDEAVSYYAAKFDSAKLRARDFPVKPTDLAAAAKRLPAADLRALKAARDSIVEFNSRGLAENWMAKNKHGALVGEKFDPIRRVGLYVPGGQVPLVSTVLMTVTLAKIAGCPEVAVFTPSNADGKLADGMLAALHLAGVTEVYRFGGVQAIGAMAYGTTTINAVDKIFGPGNAYVCEAKRQVFGTVGVDSLPGPSEVMIIADDTAKASFAAADLLAQAEHGSGREKIYLLGTSAQVIDAIVGRNAHPASAHHAQREDSAGLGKRVPGDRSEEPRARGRNRELRRARAPRTPRGRRRGEKAHDRHHNGRRHYDWQPHADRAGRFRGRTEPRAADGPRRALLQRTARRRFSTPHQHRALRSREREESRTHRRRLCRDGKTRRPRPLGADSDVTVFVAARLDVRSAP